MLSGRVRAGCVWLVLALVTASGGTGDTAHAQVSYPATVTSVVDGDTLHAQMASDGQDVTVRIIGIDTPETRKPGTPIECGGKEASSAMTDLAQGHAMNLVTDPTQDLVDRYGRSLFYVDRTDGLDLGLEMIRRGWTKAYVYNQDFARLPAYLQAESDANADQVGVWGGCEGDFHHSGDDDLRDRRDSANAFVRR